MKLFLDTGNPVEVRAAFDLGVLDGVTTNPSLIAKEKKDYRATVVEMCELGMARSGWNVSAEVLSTEFTPMLNEAHRVAAWHPSVIVKIPMTPEGVAVLSVLSKENIRTNCTLVFSVNQALLAAKAGATMVSPFLGRLDDAGNSGLLVVREIVEAYRQHGFSTQVLAASIRSPQQVADCALLGADICTLPHSVFQQLFKHPLTDAGLAKFLSDWKSAFGDRTN